MALLTQAMNVEECQRILAVEPLAPEYDEAGQIDNQPRLDLEATIRANCQAQIDVATDPVKALVALRNPVPETQEQQP